MNIIPRHGGPSWLARAASYRTTPPLLSLIMLIVVASLVLNNFLTIRNIAAVLEQVAVTAIVALGVNQVVLAGEIDISVGSLLAVCAYTFGMIAQMTNSLLIGLGASVLIGCLVGLFNGVLSTCGKIPSIIATLGTLFVLRGGILVFAGSQIVDVPPAFSVLGVGFVGPLPVSLLITLLVLCVVNLTAWHTVWGKNIVAVGGNPRAARVIGLPINATRLACFVVSGLSCGVAAAVYMGQVGEWQATAATGFELRVITAIVIGGTSIKGGAGNNFGPVIGACLVGTILNVMTLNRVPGTFELLVLGFLIFLAISVEGIRSRLSVLEP